MNRKEENGVVYDADNCYGFYNNGQLQMCFLLENYKQDDLEFKSNTRILFKQDGSVQEGYLAKKYKDFKIGSHIYIDDEGNIVEMPF